MYLDLGRWITGSALCLSRPLRPDQFDFSFHGPDRPKIIKKKKKEV